MTNHLSHLESDEVSKNGLEIIEEFLDELIMVLLEKVVQWYVYFSNSIVCGALPDDLKFQQKKRFLNNVK